MGKPNKSETINQLQAAARDGFTWIDDHGRECYIISGLMRAFDPEDGCAEWIPLEELEVSILRKDLKAVKRLAKEAKKHENNRC